MLLLNVVVHTGIWDSLATSTRQVLTIGDERLWYIQTVLQTPTMSVCVHGRMFESVCLSVCLPRA